jgi:hypothetical protein
MINREHYWVKKSDEGHNLPCTCDNLLSICWPKSWASGSRHLAFTRSNTYNLANNRYDNIIPKHMNKQRKNILRVATRS